MSWVGLPNHHVEDLFCYQLLQQVVLHLLDHLGFSLFPGSLDLVLYQCPAKLLHGVLYHQLSYLLDVYLLHVLIYYLPHKWLHDDLLHYVLLCQSLQSHLVSSLSDDLPSKSLLHAVDILT